MLRKIDPTTTQSWKKLAAHYEKMKTVHMKSLFAGDPERFAAALEKAASVSISDEVLTFSDAQGTVILSYHAL